MRLDLPAEEAHQGDVGHGLHLELDLHLLARRPQQREAGGFALLRSQACVAEPAVSSFGDADPGADADEVGQHVAFAIFDHGALGDGELEVSPLDP